MKTRAWVSCGIAVWMATAVAACGGTSGAASTASDKYHQTWATNYGETTCADWTAKMTQKQRWVAAADMLTSAQQSEGAKSMPSDELIDTFKDGITTACAIDTMSISDASALLYVTERTRFGP